MSLLSPDHHKKWSVTCNCSHMSSRWGQRETEAWLPLGLSGAKALLPGTPAPLLFSPSSSLVSLPSLLSEAMIPWTLFICRIVLGCIGGNFFLTILSSSQDTKVMTSKKRFFQIKNGPLIGWETIISLLTSTCFVVTRTGAEIYRNTRHVLH